MKLFDDEKGLLIVVEDKHKVIKADVIKALVKYEQLPHLMSLTVSEEYKGVRVKKVTLLN